MKPNNHGGRTFQNCEVPVVISAVSHQEADLAPKLTAYADRYEQKRLVILSERQRLGRRSVKHHYPDLQGDVSDEKRLVLGQSATNRALGHLMASYQDGVLFPEDRPIARRMLVEMGLVKPNFKDRLAKFGRAILRK